MRMLTLPDERYRMDLQSRDEWDYEHEVRDHKEQELPLLVCGQVTAVHGAGHDQYRDLKRHHQQTRKKQELPQVAPVKAQARTEQIREPAWALEVE
jgi:hypothetical protein